MASSEFSELQSAATESQGVLARQRGMDDTADGNLLYKGAVYVGVFGSPQVQSITMQGGGYRRRTFLPLTVTKTQSAFVPVEKTKMTRIDSDPELEYIIDTADSHDPLHWLIQLVKLGAG